MAARRGRSPEVCSRPENPDNGLLPCAPQGAMAGDAHRRDTALHGEHLDAALDAALDEAPGEAVAQTSLSTARSAAGPWSRAAPNRNPC
ncbi:hypothetical protein, partial [Actinacidiphila sp. bgisy167]|uniref:hypothetical protein n=1 Tax=Actinacidiphila sp. bgisy167 TaxID=3413797 RepID=UPI003D730299